MLFTKATLDGLADGTVDRTYRRWRAVRPRVGSTLTTRIGVVRVEGIEAVDVDRLAEVDARAAGFGTLSALRSWLDRGEGAVYEVRLAVTGPDPRVALRSQAVLTTEDRTALNRRLDRIDAAAAEPWTRRTLRQIAARPGVVSTELAAEAGQERQAWKLRVRRLKALGLTESLEVGYRISPRGAAFLAD